MINETCNLILENSGASGYELSKFFLFNSYLPLFIITLVPLIGLLLGGWITKNLSKGNFWVIFFITLFFDIIGMLLYLVIIV